MKINIVTIILMFSLVGILLIIGNLLGFGMAIRIFIMSIVIIGITIGGIKYISRYISKEKEDESI